MEKENLMSVEQVADLLGVSPVYVRKLIRDRAIHAEKIGRQSRGGVWVIDRSEAERVRLARAAQPPKAGRPPKAGQ